MAVKTVQLNSLKPGDMFTLGEGGYRVVEYSGAPQNRVWWVKNHRIDWSPGHNTVQITVPDLKLSDLTPGQRFRFGGTPSAKVHLVTDDGRFVELDTGRSFIKDGFDHFTVTVVEKSDVNN